MRFPFSILFIAGIFLVFSCKKNQRYRPEKGVSYALNEQRKKSIDSIHYAIELDIPSGKNERIKGKERISFNLNSLDSALVLDFSTDSSHVISVQSNGKAIAYEFVNQHIVIESASLVKGRNEVFIEFVAGDLSLNRSEEYLYTLFVPDRASTCFPLFDQPNLKATYALTLKTPANWEAVSNGSLQYKRSENGRNIYRFNKTQPISSYLFAFAAGKFFKTVKTVGGREMTMYYRETDTVKVRKNSDEVFSLHAKALSWLENYTSVSYPFEKFDFVLIPSFQYGGMEHPGSVFYNESSLFLDENASVNKKLSRASVIAHESAHMWFGDLVTMDWFNDVWLKEVFANFMAAKIVHPSFPEINHRLRFLLAHYPGAYEVDRSAGTNPVLQELGNLKNAGTLYGAIIYLKAPVVMQHLELKIGEKRMQESLREYLKTFAYGNARWDDLIRIIDRKTPQNISDWSAVWVKTPGMPAYDLVRKGGKMQVVQEIDPVSGRIWQQPLAVKWTTGKSYRDTAFTFTDKQVKTFDVQPETLVFPNFDGVSYGYFKMDTASKADFIQNYNQVADTVRQNPVFRGAMLVNSWEAFLRENGPSSEKFVNDIFTILPKEENPLLVDYLLSNMQTVWWTFLEPEERSILQNKAERVLWDLLEKTSDKGIKTSYFRAFKNVALTPDGLQKLELLWNEKLVVKDLVLSEDDKISLACELALKGSGDNDPIFNKQLENTGNPDRKAKLKFVIPSLSKNIAERNAFFESLKKPENREKEAWVLEALAYLHHPLRAKSAIPYLRPSLDMLQEIQLTGDIFFPTRWVHTIYAGHHSGEAAAIVQDFLRDNPEYPFYLKNKVLQATDILNRAVKLQRDAEPEK
ncbi:M1 family metallopeptidase [Dyadobacter sediminis]|uniref:Aminopeptidase N n=1 Tax=Dyadobacter sediminis TaxID=1493691 RepID=A0A5R9KKR9_9BACT|nr:M1 family aminopeptidase [Dyadobacter sediminis]TLU96803.1 peptidase M1 [Dyadobacter sediminis]GGB85277.1 aminopeptidase N [Dyadobacter sediminis]